MSKLSGIELLQTLGEICDKVQSPQCFGCPIKEVKQSGIGYDECFNIITEYPEQVSEICYKWRKDHPRYMDKFFELFPNAMKAVNGTPIACFHSIYGGEEDYSPVKNAELWRQTYKEQEK